MSKPIIWQAVFIDNYSNEEPSPNFLSTSKDEVINYVKREGYEYYSKDEDAWLNVKGGDITEGDPCYYIMPSFLVDNSLESKLLSVWQGLNDKWHSKVYEKHHIEKYGKEKYEEYKQRAISLYGPLKN